MVKHIFKIPSAIVILVFLFISCGESMTDIPQFDNCDGECSIKLIEAILTDWRVNDNLKSTAIEKTNGNLQLMWRVDDKIGIFPTTGFQTAFSIVEGVGTKNAIFDGGDRGVKSATTYSAYYPLIEEYYHDKKSIPLTLTNQEQKGNNNSDHIAAFNYMAAINSMVDDSGNVSFLFNHQVGILHLRFRMPSAGTYSKLILETNGKFTTKAILNLTDGSVTATKTLPYKPFH